MNLRQLRYFVAVSEEQHFRRAAEKLNVSQPPLSQQIKELELELGVLLLKRSNRAVELTPEGSLFLRRAKAILESVVEARREMMNFSATGGGIKIGYMSAAMASSLAPILSALRESNDGAITFKLHQLDPETQLRSVARGDLDIGFASFSARQAPVSVDDKLLVIERAWQEALRVALPRIHPLAGKTVISLDQLQNEKLIVMARNPLPGFFDQVISLCYNAGVAVDIVYEASQLPEIMTLVAAGYGISFVPERSSELWDRQLALVPLSQSPTTDVSVMYRADNESPVLGRFRKLLKKVYGSGLSEA
ncbi:MAG: LysR family transcriptional regulator [Mesorhizobium sp.]|uniref:LysR family transcriptional regulator n=1 Tax=Mesorhizobium sp. TaxID=1871066 RepID=UPI000FE97D12|nr:LysR family transcriptional regulator [Mesorhizobium sp.]RWB32237.1 MAG: LysR family transcriptional regulator [Mesorhizobium sp.]RWB82948.1 MAG: LysR family transcriptional regulator [Mesorhizobium sp.]RWF78510.1 MAG: LysR family transcriptional regulator [Mesorhizobium sp.]TIS68549.1 MAG: LysR family transcriptional regulator [Mesorhizobium sp.]